MALNSEGIHHITALASDPQRNLDFYTQVLGLRLVKLTVNFDANETYHFYFADNTGHPGTVLTFFPWQNINRGKPGTHQASTVAFTIPTNSLAFWVDRLKGLGIVIKSPIRRFDEEVIYFMDPDGLALELVTSNDISAISSWENGPIPQEHFLRGFHSATLLEATPLPTIELLTELFGFRKVAEDKNRIRFESSSSQPGRRVDIISEPDTPGGRMGAGIVHHIAWRALNDDHQTAWRIAVMERGLDVTPIVDRQYFRSIYFREPGGILFEIATDQPGFLIDESVDCLGTSLKLPTWIETRRAEITRVLPAIEIPQLCPEPA